MTCFQKIFTIRKKEKKKVTKKKRKKDLICGQYTNACKLSVT